MLQSKNAIITAWSKQLAKSSKFWLNTSACFLCCFEASRPYRTSALAAVPTIATTRTPHWKYKRIPRDEDDVILLPAVWWATCIRVVWFWSSNEESCPVVIAGSNDSIPVKISLVCVLFWYCITSKVRNAYLCTRVINIHVSLLLNTQFYFYRVL